MDTQKEKKRIDCSQCGKSFTTEVWVSIYGARTWDRTCKACKLMRVYREGEEFEIL